MTILYSSSECSGLPAPPVLGRRGLREKWRTIPGAYRAPLRGGVVISEEDLRRWIEGSRPAPPPVVTAEIEAAVRARHVCAR